MLSNKKQCLNDTEVFQNVSPSRNCDLQAKHQQNNNTISQQEQELTRTQSDAVIPAALL